VRENKIQLHKLNGVKIAVPIAKMSLEDIEYVEKATGLSFDEDKPLSAIKKGRPAPAQLQQQSYTRPSPPLQQTPRVGITIDRSNGGAPRKDYDWFDFFLSCGVEVQTCQRYALSFEKDSIDESILPDITAPVLRTLGLKEGDIIRVMKHLDAKYNRTGSMPGEGGKHHLSQASARANHDQRHLEHPLAYSLAQEERLRIIPPEADPHHLSNLLAVSTQMF
jgi:actin cytoskeleton-regulatory complex protein SLA1